MEKPRERRRRLTLTMLLRAYAMGMFSLVEDRHDLSVFCVNPEIRGFLVHLAARLRLDETLSTKTVFEPESPDLVEELSRIMARRLSDHVWLPRMRNSCPAKTP
jgi:hypothetical protein